MHALGPDLVFDYHALTLLLQVGCSKVYTSTSDVMTHENFHKKNAQLINDGFQRFRATEDCGTVGCQFYGQKTTHFHCRWIDLMWFLLEIFFFFYCIKTEFWQILFKTKKDS